MRFEHLGAQPRIHPDAVIAPTAVISGDVRIGADCQVLHGAVITAEGGAITLGENVIVMENALIRATATNPVHIGDHVLVGPMASVSGATVGDEVFLATGTRVFNGARIGERSEVEIVNTIGASMITEVATNRATVTIVSNGSRLRRWGSKGVGCAVWTGVVCMGVTP